MAQFLSPEWIDDLRRAVAGDEDLAGLASGPGLILQQVVDRGGGGEASWALRMADGQVAVEPGRTERPDVTLVEDEVTALAMARGELTAQAALLGGHIRVEGDTSALVRSQEALGQVQACLDQVRVRTTY